MKRYLQCAEQQVSLSKLTKYCACHAKWLSKISDKFLENMCEEDWSWESFCVAGAVFGEVEVSLFVAGAVFGEIWNGSRSRNVVFFNAKCSCSAWKVTSVERRVADWRFHGRILLGSWLDHGRIGPALEMITFQPARKMNLMIDPCHETLFAMRGATSVIVQTHQILRLPRKITLMINPLHTWNAIYNARSNNWQVSLSKLTKYCACHEKWISWLILVTHEMLFTKRGATSVIVQTHQILRLPRKMNLMIDPCHTWNAIYNVRSNKCHCPNSPNTAPATKNESHDRSLSHMKRYLQCAEQQVSLSKLTKYCACHAKLLSWSILFTHETLFTMRGATSVIVQTHQILRLPRKMTLMINPLHTWNAIYNARSNKCHCPNSPNTAPATKNESQDWSLSHMKRYLQWAITWLSYDLTELWLDWAITWPSYDVTELWLDWAMIWLSYDLTELWLDWAMTWLSYDLTERWFDWAMTWLSYDLTELLLDWAMTWLSYDLTELWLDWAMTWLSYDLTELWLDWAMTWLSYDLTELWFDWAMTWLSYDLTELWLDWAMTWLSYDLTELWLDWAMTWLSYDLTELWLDWAMTWLSYYLTELWLDWAIELRSHSYIGSFSTKLPLIIIKGSLDEKLPSYEVLQMRENRCLENRCLENRCLENRCLENRCQERIDAKREKMLRE